MLIFLTKPSTVVEYLVLPTAQRKYLPDLFSWWSLSCDRLGFFSYNLVLSSNHLSFCLEDSPQFISERSAAAAASAYAGCNLLYRSCTWNFVFSRPFGLEE
jgi:hypothetical protein